MGRIYTFTCGNKYKTIHCCRKTPQFQIMPRMHGKTLIILNVGAIKLMSCIAIYYLDVFMNTLRKPDIENNVIEKDRECDLLHAKTSTGLHPIIGAFNYSAPWYVEHRRYCLVCPCILWFNCLIDTTCYELHRI